MTDVHDTVALRVIIRGRKWHHDECDNVTDAREIVLCYYVQDCLMEHWPSTRISKMKDYIRHPKPNGYRSLHYTGQHKFNVLDKHTLFPFEIQIRSERMHNIAEFGVANHWEYKLHDVDDDNDDHRTGVELATDHTSDFLLHTMNFTRAIDSTDRLLNFDHIYQEPDQMSSIARSNISHLVGTSTRNLYLEALSNVRQEIANHQVFVFTVTSTSTNGDYEKYNDSEHNSGANLLSFPINANVRDVLKTICRHSSMNSTNNVRQDPCVLRNGRLARMSDKIQNGDILILQV
jgi:Region found in RelA / SpoT proteins